MALRYPGGYGRALRPVGPVVQASVMVHAVAGPQWPGRAQGPLASILTEGVGLSSTRALESFLAGIERRAFRFAQLALGHREDALDVVQEAMIQLVKRYSDRPQEEWQPLFYRILQNRIRDWQRRRTVRARVMAFLPRRDPEDERRGDPLENLPSGDPQPDRRVGLDDALDALGEAVRELPRRQQQAFLLRTVESLDVAGTARAMGCSEGSVKTHYSRAVHRLRAQLGEHWP